MENKEVRRGRNHNQWKRGIAASHVGSIDYYSNRDNIIIIINVIIRVFRFTV